jgi:hypothetical protein
MHMHVTLNLREDIRHSLSDSVYACFIVVLGNFVKSFLEVHVFVVLGNFVESFLEVHDRRDRASLCRLQ